MTIRIPTNNESTTSEVYTIDFRETAPMLAHASMYKDDPNSAAYGGLAVGVPGEVRGLEEAHRRWGILPWKRLVEPAISLASGWEVDKELGKRIPVRLCHVIFPLFCVLFTITVVPRFNAQQPRLELDFRSKW
jgi:gamma-glutamyltranspeptidase/glutathione hydrolase/leukotriene-C4 hydrolase